MRAGTGFGRGRVTVLGVIGAVALLLVAAGCAATTPEDASTTPAAGTGSADAVGIVGAWGDTDAPTSPSLVFAEDGTVSGTDGCNRLRGAWTADGDTVDFAPLASTRMFCEGVDTWLSTGASGTWTDSQLVIVDEDGTEIGTLERSG